MTILCYFDAATKSMSNFTIVCALRLLGICSYLRSHALRNCALRMLGTTCVPRLLGIVFISLL